MIGELEVGWLGAGQPGGLASQGTGAEVAPTQEEAAAAAVNPSEVAALGSALTAADQCPGGLPSLPAPATTPAAVAAWAPLPSRGEEPSSGVLAAWRPQLSPAGEWLLEEPDLHLIAIGCGILGCGGGGSPHRALLGALMELRRSGPGRGRLPVTSVDARLPCAAFRSSFPCVQPCSPSRRCCQRLQSEQVWMLARACRAGWALVACASSRPHRLQTTSSWRTQVRAGR